MSSNVSASPRTAQTAITRMSSSRCSTFHAQRGSSMVSNAVIRASSMASPSVGKGRALAGQPARIEAPDFMRSPSPSLRPSAPSPNRPFPGRAPRSRPRPPEPVRRLRPPKPARLRSRRTFAGRGGSLARRQLLTDDERRTLLGVPADPDDLARLFTPTRSDEELVARRRGRANRLGFAVQLALLRHPGTALAHLDQPVEALVAWIARQLGIPASAFAEYARRPQTMTDHARLLASALVLRAPTRADLPLMIEAAARAAWATDRGPPIVPGVVAALRGEGVILPAASVIERAAIAGRARARKRAAGAMLAGLPEAQAGRLDALLAPDPSLGATPLAWLKAAPAAPKADHVRELLDRLRLVRGIGLPPEARSRVHEERLRQLVREAHAADAYQLGRYAARRRHALLAVLVLDLEARLTDAALDMTDRLIGGLFARARNAKRRRYAGSTRDVGRLMRLFHGTIGALAAAQEGDRDAFEAVDEAVGWPRLLRVRGEVEALADLAEEDSLVRAAGRWATLRRFAPALLGALQFRAARDKAPMLAALGLLRELNRAGKRDVPPDAPMPFRKDWRRLVREEDGPTRRRLYETAVLARPRGRLRSGDVWVERSSDYRRFDSYLLPPAAVPAAVAGLGLPGTADEWLPPPRGGGARGGARGARPRPRGRGA